LSNSIPKDLVHAKELIKKNNFNDAFQVLSDFEEKEGNSLHNKVLCHLLQCQLLLWQGEYVDAINLAERAYNDSLKLGKNILAVDLLLLRVDALLWNYQMDKAFDVLIQAEELINTYSEEMPNECLKQVAYMSYLKSTYYGRRNDPDLDRIFENAERSLELRKKLGNKLDIGISLLNYGDTLTYFKLEMDRGLEYLTQAFEIGKKYDIKYLLALATRSLMIYYGNMGEIDLSLMYAEQSLIFFKQINNKSRAAVILSVIGDHYKLKGEFDRSIEYMEQALVINKEIRGTSQEPLILSNLVQLNLERGDLNNAQQYFKQLEQLNNQVDNEWINYLYRSSKAQLLKKSSRIKNLESAQELYKELIEEKTLFHNEIVLEYCDLLLIELGMTNDVVILDEIRFYLNELIESSERSNSFWLLANSYLIQGKVSLIKSDLKKARRFLIQGQKIAERQGYQKLAIEFTKEYEDLNAQEHLWENFNITNASISERLSLAKISEHIKQTLRNRTKLTTQITDEDFTIHKERKICLVCRGEIKGYMYVCECNANYCESCAQALTNLENVCCVCNAPMDQSKPIKPYKVDEKEIDLKISNNDSKAFKK